MADATAELDGGPGDVDAGSPGDDAGSPGDDAGSPGDDAGPDGGTQGPPQWWSDAHALAIELNVTGGAMATADVPVVIDAPLQSLIGARGTLDSSSPRVVEHGASGPVELPSWFSADQGSGMLALLLPGELGAGETRRLYVYLALDEEGGVAPPSYWLNETRDPVDGPSVSIDDLNSFPLRVYHLTDPDIAVVVNNCWRLFSTNVDHYGAPTALGSNTFTPLQNATVRLDEPELMVVEAIASAGPARLRQLTLLTSERGILTALRIEDLELGAPLEAYAYADIDLPDSSSGDDTGFLDTSLDVAVIEDQTTSQLAVLMHDGRAELETVANYVTVAQQVRDRALSGNGDLSSGTDAAAAMRWTFPAVSEPVLVKSATLLVDNSSDAARIRRRFFAPSAVLGTVHSRP